MANSTNIIGDLETVRASTPATVTLANASAAAGPIMDYPGNVALAKEKAREAAKLLAAIKDVTDAGDGNLTNVNAVLAVLNGTSGPSTQAVTDITSVYNTAPAAATSAAASAAAGPIMDYVGNVKLVQIMLRELKVLVTALKGVTDNGTDGTNRTLLDNVITSLA